MKSILTLLLLIFSLAVSAQQLTYKPKNPAFGGDTFNYQWLLSSANAQNDFEEQSDRDIDSELEDFAKGLNRQLLGQLERTLLTNQLGDGDLKPGTFSFGSLEVEIYESLEGLVVNILDTNTGEQTQIIVPN
ncbi:curli production assembly/transport component CsgF [Mesonia sediminis]|jgi:curli production assembly/transport component CsgF|uniref:Curli production assembly/transport component CsgF n=1 Tax=Mesonia sediminis TaxID=1703946 RepID=A0ABW5SJD3_9FLAO|nr:curli production assembly/transport component CsgF [Mesonia sp. HuA40]TXK73600.1 curli assembly protein CsgF [Mesonia sp. HuA40]